MARTIWLGLASDSNRIFPKIKSKTAPPIREQTISTRMWYVVGLLESCEGRAEFVHGRAGDGLPDRLVDLLPHVRRELVHGVGRSLRVRPTTRPPSVVLHI